MSREAILSLLLVAGAALVLSQTGPGLPCICLERLNQSSPIQTATSIKNAGDGSGRLFVTEQAGVIWIYDTNGTRYPEPFLNLTGKLDLDYINGLLSITFHPDFANNGLAYVYYSELISPVRPIGPIDNVVYEFQVSATDPNKLDTTTGRFVFNVYCASGACHNGGTFLFGPDNYLYIGHGDWGCCDDTPNHGQNRTNYLAAIHRIDVDSRTGNLPYGIPPDNPFLSDPTTPPEMFAWGLRQPYCSSMDKGDPNTGEGYGRIFVGDVGEFTWEEINVLQAGGNYGWSAYEGTTCFKPEFCGNIGPHIPPVAQYNHSHYGISVILGHVYRGSSIPEFNGWLLFADFLTKFFAMYEVTPDNWEWQETPTCEICPDGLTNHYPSYLMCMGADEAGEQYFTAAYVSPYENPYAPTRLYRISNPNLP